MTRTLPLATLAGGGAILLWSTSVAVARSLSERLGPVSAAAAVTVIAGIAALFALLCNPQKRQRISRLPARYLIGCGGLFVGYTVFFYLALGWVRTRQEVLEVGLLNYLWPTLTLVFSLALLGKKASWILLPGTLLALAGISLVVNHQEASVAWLSPGRSFLRNPVAYSLAIAAAVSWALYSNLTRRWAGEHEEGAVALFLPATAMVLLVMCGFVHEPREWSRPVLVESLFLGVSTYIAYSLWDLAMRRGNVVVVAAGSYLTPLLSTFVTCLYLAVMPGVRLWVGCVVLVLGSFLSWRSVANAAGEQNW